MMQNDREIFLKKIRQALKAGYPTGVEKPRPDDYTLARLVSADAADLPERFARWAVEEGMYLYRLKNPPDLVARLIDLLDELSVQKLMAADDPLLTKLGVIEALKLKPNIELLSFGKNQDSLINAAFNADASLAPAKWALAETGSLVLTSSPAQPRLLHLAPPVHISILSADRIKADLLDLLQPENLVGAVTLVTGPSKTSDIEMKLVTGVHGPTAEHILLLEYSAYW